MLERRQGKVQSQSPWMVAVVALLLLVVLMAAVGHSPVAVCCLVLVPVFLFALVELPAYVVLEEFAGGYVFEDGSPFRFDRPPPSIA